MEAVLENEEIKESLLKDANKVNSRIKDAIETLDSMLEDFANIEVGGTVGNPYALVPLEYIEHITNTIGCVSSDLEYAKQLVEILKAK